MYCFVIECGNHVLSGVFESDHRLWFQKPASSQHFGQGRYSYAYSSL